MKWNIDDLPVFVAVIEENGITAAARRLAMPKSTVSNAIGRLEAALGLRLIDRDSRRLRITSEGETFFAHAQAILEQAREADAAMAGLSATPSGRLTVALPPAFCDEIFAPRFAEFRTLYPEIVLDIVVTSHGTEMLRGAVDMAVVVGPIDDSDFVARTVLSGPLVWVTTPAYLARHPLGATPAEVVAHVQIVEKRYGLARLPVHVGGQAAQIDLSRGVSHVNNPLAVRRAVLAGAGVSLLPRHYCRAQIAEGALVEVARDITVDLSASRLTAVYPSRRLISPRLRAFLDFLDLICRG